ncbi:MAG: DUF4157 domain-containing protein [Cyanobacteria bacterium P01_D01_bin.156]
MVRRRQRQTQQDLPPVAQLDRPSSSNSLFASDIDTSEWNSEENSETISPQNLLTHSQQQGFQFSHTPILSTAEKQAPSSPIQAKLAVGSANDAYEQEADDISEQVIGQIYESGDGHLPQNTINLHKKSPSPFKALQCYRSTPQPAKGQQPVSPEVETQVDHMRGKGQSLPRETQQTMEQAFGTDFSTVKIHTDNQAHRLNESVQAKAFTTGPDIFFRRGTYQPSHQEGQKLIAHELTHVVQQQRSPTGQTTILQRDPTNNSSDKTSAETDDKDDIKATSEGEASASSTADTGGEMNDFDLGQSPSVGISGLLARGRSSSRRPIGKKADSLKPTNTGSSNKQLIHSSTSPTTNTGKNSSFLGKRNPHIKFGVLDPDLEAEFNHSPTFDHVDDTSQYHRTSQPLKRVGNHSTERSLEQYLSEASLEIANIENEVLNIADKSSEEGKNSQENLSELKIKEEKIKEIFETLDKCRIGLRTKNVDASHDDFLGETQENNSESFEKLRLKYAEAKIIKGKIEDLITENKYESIRQNIDGETLLTDVEVGGAASTVTNAALGTLDTAKASTYQYSKQVYEDSKYVQNKANQIGGYAEYVEDAQTAYSKADELDKIPPNKVLSSDEQVKIQDLRLKKENIVKRITLKRTKKESIEAKLKDKSLLVEADDYADKLKKAQSIVEFKQEFVYYFYDQTKIIQEEFKDKEENPEKNKATAKANVMAAHAKSAADEIRGHRLEAKKIRNDLRKQGVYPDIPHAIAGAAKTEVRDFLVGVATLGLGTAKAQKDKRGYTEGTEYTSIFSQVKEAYQKVKALTNINPDEDGYLDKFAAGLEVINSCLIEPVKRVAKNIGLLATGLSFVPVPGIQIVTVTIATIASTVKLILSTIKAAISAVIGVIRGLQTVISAWWAQDPRTAMYRQAQLQDSGFTTLKDAAGVGGSELTGFMASISELNKIEPVTTQDIFSGNLEGEVTENINSKIEAKLPEENGASTSEAESATLQEQFKAKAAKVPEQALSIAQTVAVQGPSAAVDSTTAIASAAYLSGVNDNTDTRKQQEAGKLSPTAGHQTGAVSNNALSAASTMERKVSKGLIMQRRDKATEKLGYITQNFGDADRKVGDVEKKSNELNTGLQPQASQSNDTAEVTEEDRSSASGTVQKIKDTLQDAKDGFAAGKSFLQQGQKGVEKAVTSKLEE